MTDWGKFFEDQEKEDGKLVRILKHLNVYDEFRRINRQKGLADFHFHTKHSDGSASVAEAVAEAELWGVEALALTDHNTENGTQEFMALCKRAGIMAFEGTEIYAAFPAEKWAWDMTKCGPVPDVTILGNRLDWAKFAEYKKNLNNYWETTWIPQTLEKLRELGFKVPDLSQKDIQDQAKIAVPPVFHDVPKNFENLSVLFKIAQEFDSSVTLKDVQQNPVATANRYVYSIQGGAYVLRGPQEFGVSEAVDLADQMGGVLFAAHPGGNYANWSIEHLDYFVQNGGGGIEVWQYYHKPDQTRLFLEYAVRYELLVSGGSDWHGKNGKAGLGCWDKPENQTPAWVANQLFDLLP